MQITEQDVDRIYREHGSRLGGRREDYFGFAYITQAFNLPEDIAARQVAFGSTLTSSSIGPM